MKYSISLLLLLLSGMAFGQDDPQQDAQSPETEQPEVKKPKRDSVSYKPTGFRLGTDLISLGKTADGRKFTGWEFNGDIDFDRFYFAVDYGSWSRHANLPNGAYDNDGKYYRIGVDINFLLKDPDKNMFFLGLRYGHSDFSEQLEYVTTSTVFGDATTTLSNTNLRAGWGELTFGLRVKIWKSIWMGYTARLKLFPQVTSTDVLQPYDIPGYGLASKTTYYGFNYQLFWRIPFRKN